jgi:sugar phosphate isomerase/epimerase
VNCYSGHGTYSTLGLGHHDPRVRAHIRDAWVRPMLHLAGQLGAGLGFFAHAFPEAVLRDPARYRAAYDALVDDLRALAAAAREAGAPVFGIEQMYSPHQIPWTLAGAEEFLRRLNSDAPGTPPAPAVLNSTGQTGGWDTRRHGLGPIPSRGGGRPARPVPSRPVETTTAAWAYLTIDTGHACGQDRFLPPTEDAVSRFLEEARAGRPDALYLGPAECHAPIRRLAAGGASREAVSEAIRALLASHPFLFSAPGDGDPYRWLERFGAYSPIVHLQQTNGRESGHKAFTAELNEWGIIRAPDVLRALGRSYATPAPEGFPPQAANLYLTLEPFLPTASHPRLMLEQIAESVAYWRRYVPRDGMDIGAVCAALRA